MFWRRRRKERDLERELQSHIDLEAEEQQQSGLAAEDARHAARRALGNLTLLQEDTRSMWGWASLEQLLQDLRYGFRFLRKNPAFTIVAILALALGIGVNTAIFSVINTVLLRPLPYANSDRLVELWQTSRDGSEMGGSYPDFEDWRSQADFFEELATAYPFDGTFTAPGAPAERLRVAYVSGNYFEVFKVRAALGRGFTEDDNRKGGSPVAVLSHEFWQKRFSGDSGILGRSVTVDGRSLTVVGVLPPRALAEYRNGDLYAPVELAVVQFSLQRGNHESRSGVVGRLKSGVSLERLQAQMSAVAAGQEG